MLAVLLSAGWAALHTLQYGFSISEFNGIQSVVICPSTGVKTDGYLKGCLPITQNQFTFAVSIFTLGGLLGSLAAGPLMKHWSRLAVLRMSAASVFLGSAAAGMANELATLVLGRIILGLGCGLATVAVPLFLADIAPARMKKSLGIANQLFITFGILIAQSLSFPFGKELQWRWVLAVGCLIAVLQLVTSFFVPQQAPAAGEGERAPLLPATGTDSKILSIKELFTSASPAVTRGFALVVVTQLSQQLCGISPVMYFSTSILTPVFQANSRYIALGIVLLKIPITTLPAFLIERYGSKRILLCSSLAVSLSALLLGLGLNADSQALSVVSILAFVASFSMGLGPVTWVVLPEVMPAHAVGAAGSIGLALNWSANFAMGASFVPLKNWLAKLSGEGHGEGTIFFVYSALSFCGCVAIWKGFVRREQV